MAGGKETPRQKMIGMMYLVLTALLALNVSKSILDAFVAIEENTQKANIVLVENGNSSYKSVTSELASTKDDKENAPKREKLEFVIKQMDKINKVTGDMIEKIDKLKLKILEESGEDIKPKDKGPESIVWTTYDFKKNGVLPGRMKLMPVQAKDQYDIPMHTIIGEDIKNPTGDGKQLWADFLKFRKDIVSLTGTYEWTGKKYSINVKDINSYKSNQELSAQVDKMIASSKANIKDDAAILKKLYVGLTKLEKNEVHDLKDVHWIGMTFDHSPLVAAVASLSSMQQDILSARATALEHWKGKVSTGEYSFNKIMPLAYGPVVANRGEEVELQVMMAAFDSDNQPTVTVTGGSEGAKVSYEGDGQGRVKFSTSGSNMKLTGTVSIKNKSGVAKVEPWTHEIIVMEPTGSIELVELNVLYRGYPNKVEASGSGYQTTSLSGSNVSISKSGKGYIVKPGKGRSATLSVTGKNADGASKVLKKGDYRVSNLPDPTLYWGSAKSGAKGSKGSRLLQAKYPPEIPLKANFTVVRWTCYAPGLKGAPPSGAGGNIAGAGPLINALKPGSGISFTCTVRGPDGIGRQVGGGWSL